MRIRFYLREDKPNQAGYVPIFVSVSWHQRQVRRSTGDAVKPEWWDDDTKLVRAVKGSYFADINGRLGALRNRVEQLQQRAEQEQRLPTQEEVVAALTNAEPPVPEPEPSPAELAGLTSLSVPDLFRAWVDEEKAKVSKRTGQARARTTISNLNGTYEKLREFEAVRGEPLDLATMDLRRFYHPFWEWLTKDLGQSINTFGKHITRLRTFMAWAEDQELKVNRQYRKFEAPSLYVGVEALTAPELQSIAALDFQSDELRRRLYYGYSAKLGGTLDSPEVVAYIAEVELARDKFLECAYSAMHISDADRARRSDVRHVPGQSDRVLIVSRGKTRNPCYIPFFDDNVFKLVSLTAKYEARTALLVPECPTVNRHLKTIAKLVDLTRLKLTTKIGRKTFVTIKIMTGTPTRLVMMATGHTTEQSFNHYLGVDLVKFLEQYRRHQL